MIGRRASSIPRIAAAVWVVVAPSLIVLAVLAGWGFLATPAALIAGAVILVVTALVIGRAVSDLAVLRDSVDTLGAADEGTEAVSRQIARKLTPMARELWLAIVRLGRLWHERVRTAEGRVAAAEAVIALLAVATDHGLSSVIAETTLDNVPSQRTLVRAGFRLVSTGAELHRYEVLLKGSTAT